MRIVFTLTIVALLWRYKSKGFSELIEELGCHHTEFRLTCETFNAKIAILEARFSKNDSFLEAVNTSCGFPTNGTSWKVDKLKNWENFFYRKNNSEGIPVSFRHAINRRCSGVNYCSFVLSEDFEEASSLGPGAVYLRYACVDERHLTRACNSNIDASEEGFVKTPGYPHYYVGESTCQWTLRASPPQRVRIAFLDVSLRGIAPHEGECLDWVTVAEDGLNLLSACGDISEDVLILSDGPALNVSFKSSSRTLFPKRGLLFHYKAVGCPSLQKPRDGYLVNRNGSFVHYRCCVGFVFPDTLSRDRILNCYNENTWDTVIMDCVNVTEVGKLRNITTNILKELGVEVKEEMDHDADLVQDVVLPPIVISFMFIGNAVLLYIIYIKRRKQEKSEKEKEKMDNTKKTEKVEMGEMEGHGSSEEKHKKPGEHSKQEGHEKHEKKKWWHAFSKMVPRHKRNN